MLETSSEEGDGSFALYPLIKYEMSSCRVYVLSSSPCWSRADFCPSYHLYLTVFEQGHVFLAPSLLSGV